jgi:hypothetical protein
MTFKDSIAPFDIVSRHGYYKVGDQNFSHKVYALQYASSSNLPVRWIFNDEVYAKQKWSERLGIPLSYLYGQRAQQLRDRYQYLILCWSGGGDSTTVLDSFLSNNIRLDEIVVIWPVTQSQGKYVPTKDIRATNMLSEWDLVIKPRLEQLHRSHPSIRITIADVLSDMKSVEFCDDTVQIAEKHNFATIQRFRSLDAVIEQRQTHYKNIATIMGVGPVEVAILDEYLAVWFQDGPANPGSKTDITARGWLRNIEYFYWTPDMPEIVREQAHNIADHLDLYPIDRQKIMTMTLDRSGTLQIVRDPDREQVRRLRKKIIYPQYDQTTFQTLKPKDTHYQLDNFQWFYQNPHSREFTDPWNSAITAHQALIDPKFFVTKHKRITGYQTFYSKFYFIRRLKKYEYHTTDDVSLSPGEISIVN